MKTASVVRGEGDTVMKTASVVRGKGAGAMVQGPDGVWVNIREMVWTKPAPVAKKAQS
jgi:hypothetical protein